MAGAVLPRKGAAVGEPTVESRMRSACRTADQPKEGEALGGECASRPKPVGKVDGTRFCHHDAPNRQDFLERYVLAQHQILQGPLVGSLGQDPQCREVPQVPGILRRDGTHLQLEKLVLIFRRSGEKRRGSTQTG